MFGKHGKQLFLRKKVVFQKSSMFGKFVKIDYNLKLIILSWKIAYKHKQFFGAYDYK